jgi:hypothetical protein
LFRFLCDTIHITMSEKVIFRVRRDPEKPVTTAELDAALKLAASDAEDGKDGAPGPKGPKGDRGTPGENAYQVWLDEGHEGTKKDFLASLKGKRGPTGYPGAPGSAGIRGPVGADGGDSAPRSATLTRDSNGRVLSVSVEGAPAPWVISRNPSGSVASMTDTIHSVEVDRDEDEIVTGVTATEL